MQRVRLIAAAKNIRTEEINVHLKVKPEWFLTKISSYGQVPVIEHEGRVIRESIIAFGEFLTYFRVLNNCAKDEFKSQPLIPLVGRPSPVDYVDEVFPGSLSGRLTPTKRLWIDFYLTTLEIRYAIQVQCCAMYLLHAHVYGCVLLH